MNKNETLDTLINIISEENLIEDFQITDLTDELRYFDLFACIKEKFPAFQKRNVVLYKIPDIEEQRIIIEDKNQIEQLLFEDYEIKEINGKKVKFIEFKIFFLEKKILRVYFFALNNESNIVYCDIIKKFFRRFVIKYILDYDNKFEFIFTDKEISIIRNENDEIVVITTGRFVNYVLNELNATCILIFTMPENLKSLKSDYLNEKYPNIKGIDTRIECLLKDEYFLGN